MHMGKLSKVDQYGHHHHHDDDDDDDDNLVHRQFLRPTTTVNIMKKQKAQKKKKKKQKDPVKITYISSPTLVKATNASEFRAIVQELTGKNSRVGEEDEYHHHDDLCFWDVTAAATGSSTPEDQQVPSYSHENWKMEFEGVAEDGSFSNNSPVTTTTTTTATTSYSSVEIEEGFSFWRDVSETFGTGLYSPNCVFV